MRRIDELDRRSVYVIGDPTVGEIYRFHPRRVEAECQEVQRKEREDNIKKLIWLILFP